MDTKGVVILKKNKDDIIKFRCSEDEKKILKDMAKNSGLNLSEYIRGVVLSQVKKI